MAEITSKTEKIEEAKEDTNKPSNLPDENNEVKGESCWENFMHIGDVYDDAFEQLEGSTRADIMEYIDNSIYNGLVSVYSPQDGDQMEMFEKPTIIILHDMKKRYVKVLDYWSKYLLPAMQELQHEVKFLVCDIEESQFKIFDIRRYCNYWSYKHYGRFICVENSPRIFGMDIGKHLHQMTKSCSCETFREFVKNTARNELFISEPIAAEDSDQLIRTAVGNSFQELVMHNQHDVFLRIYNSYTTDDNYNSELLLHLTKIAEILRDEDIVFLKIDAHKNTIPLQFRGGNYFIPMLKREKPLMFCNILSMKGIIKFISANSSVELRGYNREGKPK